MELQTSTPATEDPTTEGRRALVERLQTSGESDFLRAVAEAVLQILREAEVEGLLGAGRRECSAERLNGRTGYRDRAFDTRFDPLSLRLPKRRQGSAFPEPRQTAGKALVTGIQEVRIGGVSTRQNDERVPATGLSGLSKSQSLPRRRPGSRSGARDRRARQCLSRPA